MKTTTSRILGSGFAVILSAMLSGTSAATAPPVTLRAMYGLEPPSSLSAAHTALVLVDFQKEFVDGRLPLPEVRVAIEHAAELTAWARRAGILIVFVRHVASRPDSKVFAQGSKTVDFVAGLRPDQRDLVVEKSMMGAFTRTDLDAELRGRHIDTLIVGGLMTHLAVQSTVNDGAVLGHRVIVAGDATATRALPGVDGERGVDAATLKRVALASMADRVADVMLSRAVMRLHVTP
jgi:nicotinamidase-related amidase